MIKIRSSIFNLIPFLIIIAGALFVRLYGLSDYAFNDDELWHLVVADQKSLFDVILYNFQQEIHPPLSYIIWHLMLKVSANELWLRMSSIVPGILLIPSGYYLGRLYFGKVAGWVIAFIFAFGILPVVISVSIRAYSPLMLTLVWMAIFVHKYVTENPKPKYLIYYFLLALMAIELHHGAAFPLFAFGLTLLFQSFRNKNSRDFIIIALMHSVLAIAVIGYEVILFRYFGFGVNEGYFVPGDSLMSKFYTYFNRSFFLLAHFFVREFITTPIFLFLVVGFVVVPISLFRGKKWMLLNLVFTPIIALSFADYFGLYPFSQTYRNNLFLCVSLIIICGYFTQMICVYAVEIRFKLDQLSKFTLKELIQNKNLSMSLLIYKAVLALYQNYLKRVNPRLNLPLVILAVTLLLVISISQNHFFRKDLPGCIELSISKSDKTLLHEKLTQKNTADNVFVTVQRNIWDMQFMSENHGQIEVITKNLAKFQNDKMTVYFTAFPAREKSNTSAMVEYKLFFEDLFSYLKSKGNFNKVTSITFFDYGLAVDAMADIFKPKLIEEYYEDDNFDYKNLKKEEYDMSWAIHSSKQVLDKFYTVPLGSACGREILIFSFTPKFVEDEILAKRFLQFR